MKQGERKRGEESGGGLGGALDRSARLAASHEVNNLQGIEGKAIE